MADATLPSDVHVEDYSGDPPPVQTPTATADETRPPPVVQPDDTLVRQIASIPAIRPTAKQWTIIAGICLAIGVLWTWTKILEASAARTKAQGEINAQIIRGR